MNIQWIQPTNDFELWLHGYKDQMDKYDNDMAFKMWAEIVGDASNNPGTETFLQIILNLTRRRMAGVGITVGLKEVEMAILSFGQKAKLYISSIDNVSTIEGEMLTAELGEEFKKLQCILINRLNEVFPDEI